MLVALSHAVLLHNSQESAKSEDLANRLEKASQAVKLAYSQCPSYDKLVPALLQYPVEVRRYTSVCYLLEGFLNRMKNYQDG